MRIKHHPELPNRPQGSHHSLSALGFDCGIFGKDGLLPDRYIAPTNAAESASFGIVAFNLVRLFGRATG